MNAVRVVRLVKERSRYSFRFDTFPEFMFSTLPLFLFKISHQNHWIFCFHICQNPDIEKSDRRLKNCNFLFIENEKVAISSFLFLDIPKNAYPLRAASSFSITGTKDSFISDNISRCIRWGSAVSDPAIIQVSDENLHHRILHLAKPEWISENQFL
jgi:hypothetical protein